MGEIWWKITVTWKDGRRVYWSQEIQYRSCYGQYIFCVVIQGTGNINQSNKLASNEYSLRYGWILVENSSYVEGRVEGILEPRNTIQHLVWPVYVLCSQPRYGQHKSINKSGNGQVFVKLWVEDDGELWWRLGWENREKFHTIWFTYEYERCPIMVPIHVAFIHN